MDRSPNFVRTHTHILIKSRTRLVSTPHYEDLPPTRTNGALPSIPRCTTRDGRSPREVPLAVCVVVVVRRASSSSERTHDTTRARTFPRIRTSRATARRVVARTTRTRARATPKGTRTHRHRIVPSASSIVLVVLVVVVVVATPPTSRNTIAYILRQPKHARTSSHARRRRRRRRDSPNRTGPRSRRARVQRNRSLARAGLASRARATLERARAPSDFATGAMRSGFPI